MQALIRVSGTSPTTDATIKIELPRYKGIAEDYHNIRFRTMTGQVIPHWVEDTSKGVIWVKLPHIGEAGATFYVEWGNWNSGCGDIEGIAYKGIGDDFEGTSLDTSKWNSGIGSAGGSINISDSAVALSPNVPSSGGNACAIWSVQTVTNNIIIRERRKFTDEHYVDIGLNKNLDYLNIHHVYTADNIGYGYAMQSPISGADTKNVFISRRDPGSVTYIGLCGSNMTSLNNFHITEAIYKSNGDLIYIHQPSTGESGWNLSWNDTTYLNDAKHITLWQGKYKSGAGGISYIDWVFVRKYLDPEPEVLDIRPIPSIEEILPYIVTAGTPFVIYIPSIGQNAWLIEKENELENKIGEAISIAQTNEAQVNKKIEQISTVENDITELKILIDELTVVIGEQKSDALNNEAQVANKLTEAVSSQITKVAIDETIYNSVLTKISALRSELMNCISKIAELTETTQIQENQVAKELKTITQVLNQLVETFEKYSIVESTNAELVTKLNALVSEVSTLMSSMSISDVEVKKLMVKVYKTIVRIVEKFKLILE